MIQLSKILLTGSSGFIGKNLTEIFKSDYLINNYIKGDNIIINEEVVIHLAGKANDDKNTSSPDEYYQVNTELAKKIFDAFLKSDAKIFITFSSVKAVADLTVVELTEDASPNPITHYGKSKLFAEQYILSKEIPVGKRFYILRPCMIHGPGNKGNLNLLYKLASKGLPWPLGAFDNNRSFCSIGNLLFIIKELIEREDIPTGIYNVADDDALSTNEVIAILAESQKRKIKIWKISKGVIQTAAKIGSILKLPLNLERLHKLTDSYEVSNQKIKTAIGKPLPVSSKEGLLKTFNSFNNR